jgi:hypothetical protein
MMVGGTGKWLTGAMIVYPFSSLPLIIRLKASTT